MMKISFIMLSLVTITLVGCSHVTQVKSETKSYEDISVETLAIMIEERRDSFLLINTHIPFEGNIPGTDLLFRQV